MNHINTRLRLLKAFLLAVVLAIAFGVIASAHTDDGGDGEIYVLYPDICRGLEPYGWWWYFWDCSPAPKDN